ncbi:MAG: PEP-CTERM sorting domain-containing protein [Myxococcales bacterium]|nr:PEP-CTERM sorting domain-containing protein [Myxococcales bacterium]
MRIQWQRHGAERRQGTKLARALAVAFAALVAAGAAQAITVGAYSLDVEITRGGKFGLNDGDLLLDAGQVYVDTGAITGVGTEYADVVDFHMTLGTETWGWYPAPIVPGVNGYGTYPTVNRATYTDGVLTRIELASASQNGHLLELGGTNTVGALGDLSLFGDNYFVGEVRGRYTANPIPEPSAALAFAIGGAVAAVRIRRR